MLSEAKHLGFTNVFRLPEILREYAQDDSYRRWRECTQVLPEDPMPLLDGQLEAVESAMPMRVRGQVQAIQGLTIEATDLAVPVGSTCRIRGMSGHEALAEVVGFQDDRTLLMPLETIAGISRGDAIENVATAPRIACSSQMLGRVLNGFGQPIDSKPPIAPLQIRRIDGKGVAPLHRENIDEPFATGIRAVDGLLTCGRGQRMGIFSGPGVGKSTILSCIARHAESDVAVIGLIGERGWEVQDFLKKDLGEQGLARSVVIVSTPNDPPLLRVRAAKLAATISEYFRDLGKNVLLLMDSLTRLCQAQRQIGLAAREPPAARGFPPSVFSLLPELLERAGKTPRGSITAFYSILVEGDDFNEPIADAVKGIIDGHLWLSRKLANREHFPAIDVLQSISRVRDDVIDSQQLQHARRVLSLLATYHEIEDLVSIGAYVPGKSAELDLAVAARPRILEFLRQSPDLVCTLEETQRRLAELVASF